MDRAQIQAKPTKARAGGAGGLGGVGLAAGPGLFVGWQCPCATSPPASVALAHPPDLCNFASRKFVGVAKTNFCVQSPLFARSRRSARPPRRRRSAPRPRWPPRWCRRPTTWSAPPESASRTASAAVCLAQFLAGQVPLCTICNNGTLFLRRRSASPLRIRGLYSSARPLHCEAALPESWLASGRPRRWR